MSTRKAQLRTLGVICPSLAKGDDNVGAVVDFSGWPHAGPGDGCQVFVYIGAVEITHFIQRLAQPFEVASPGDLKSRKAAFFGF